ncbi:MAG: helix-turn-helix domain-containing protein [Actinomycetota bacterium]
MTSELTPPPTPPATKPVGRPPRFQRDDIVAAGLALVAEHGMDGLGVRRLATALGTTPATLYRHVGSQEQLMAAVVDAGLAEIELLDPPEPDELRDWLIEATRRFRAGMLRYPGMADYLLLRGPSGPVGLTAMASICAVLARTGRAPQQVAWAYDWLMTTVAVYTSKAERIERVGGGPQVAKELVARGQHLEDDQLMAVLTEFRGDMSLSFDRATQTVIDVILDPEGPLRS